MKRILTALLLSQLAACATLDPHDVVTRRLGQSHSSQQQALDLATRTQAFDMVWQRIADRYVDPTLRGVDWKAAGDRFRPLAMTAPSDDMFWDTLDRMAAELGDAHTLVMSPRQYASLKTKTPLTLGLSLREMNGELVVVAVASGSKAERQGIVVGNSIRQIEGQPAAEWWRTVLEGTRKNSTQRARHKTVQRIFNSGSPAHPASQVNIVVERNDGSTQALALTRSLNASPTVLTTRRLPSGYGYLRLSAFDPDLNKRHAVEAAVADLRDHPGLLIDLRGNGGGSTDVANVLMSQLVGVKAPVGKVRTRDGKPAAALFGLIRLMGPEFVLHGSATPYKGKVVVLIDEGSASASELATASLRGLGRVKVVGETSCGCLLGHFGFTSLPGGGALAYSELDFEPVGGAWVEGQGIVPDLEVKPSRASLVAGRDAAVEAGIALLDEMTGKTAGKPAGAAPSAPAARAGQP